MFASQLKVMHYIFDSITCDDGQWGGVQVKSQHNESEWGIRLHSKEPEDLHQLADWLKAEANRFERIRDENNRRRGS